MRAKWIVALALAAALVAVAFAAVPATASAGTGSPFRHAVNRLDHALQLAIEDQPEGLLMSLAASERVCWLGALTEERGEPAAASADWSTLEQLVQQLDEPGLHGVEEGFGRAASVLAGLGENFSRAWRGQHRARTLRGAAAMVRSGINETLAALQPLRQAFAAWAAHRCEAALAAINTSDRQIPTAIETITRGMERLWILTLAARRPLAAPAAWRPSRVA